MTKLSDATLEQVKELSIIATHYKTMLDSLCKAIETIVEKEVGTSKGNLNTDTGEFEADA